MNSGKAVRWVRRCLFGFSCVVACSLISATCVQIPQPGAGYTVTNLVSDGTPAAAHTDAHLINGWGVAFNPVGFAWVSAAETGVSTLYDGQGNPQSLVVTVPAPQGSAEPGHPTGIVYSGGSDFVVTKGTNSGPSRFIFATEDGTIAGWSSTVDLNNAITVVANSGAGTIYKGLALVGNGTVDQIFVTDFHNNKVETYDGTFAPIPTGTRFVDPDMPDGYAPFGISNIGDQLYVTFALQDADAHDDVPGAGHGFVDVFDTNGNFVKRFASQGALDSPWGVVKAPLLFGEFSLAILVGNFGDGKINAYSESTGAMLGTLSTPTGDPIVIDGLWGMAFGNGFNNQPTNVLFFAAGPDSEAHGVYGKIVP